MNKQRLTAESAEDAEMMDINKLTEIVISSAIEVHRALGPGLLESTYEMCLCRELSLRPISFERECPIPVVYKGVKLDCGYRADLVIDRLLLLGVSAVPRPPGLPTGTPVSSLA